MLHGLYENLTKSEKNSRLLLLMYRRFFALLAATALVGLSTQALAASFSDTENTVYNDAFTYLSGKGIVRGYSDGLARPNRYLNRAEALKVLMTSQNSTAKRVAWYQNNMPPLPLFLDINQQQWFTPFVETAFEIGVVKGYPDGTLRPGQLLRVEEAVVLLMRSFGEDAYATEAGLSDDIENHAGQWYTHAINVAIRRNLIMKQQSMLRLGQPITRGQFFEMTYRMMRVKETGAIAFDDGGTPVVQQNNPVSQPPVHVINQPQPAVTAGSNPYASEQYFSISMPSLGVSDLTVTHPADPLSQQGVLAPLQDGVGHLFSYPGAGGKIMIYGHSSGYPWDVSQYTKIFRKVNQLNVGDKIYVTYEGNFYTYEVTHEQAVSANDTSPFSDNGIGEELILYTCWPPDSIAQRYLVHARPIDSVALR